MGAEGTDRRICAGLAIATRQAGQGPLPALFLHCSLASGAALVPLVDYLDNVVRADLPDFPGHGGSADVDPGRDYLTACIDAAEAMVDTPRDLVGHSLGGAVALGVAVRRPDLVRRLVLIEPVLFAAAAGTPEAERHAAQHQEIGALLERGEAEAATRLFTGLWGSGVPWDALPGPVREAMVRRIGLIPASHPGLALDRAGILTPGGLERVGAPVLFLRGAGSRPIVTAVRDGLARRLAVFREEVIAGAGHMAPITHPGATAAAIRSHLLD